MYQKVSNIELGGGCKGSPVNTNTHYRTKGTFPIAQANLKHDKSKEIIVSTHKIPGKVSPGKYKIYSQQTSRHGSVLENENSFIQMKDSSISSPVYHQMVKVKSPLRDASNQTPSNIQSRQFVRVNFISNSPNCSRTSSTHLREFRQSPSKMVTCIAADKDTRDEVLERKMKVLQGRIGELHKEKQELMGRLNEENRKIYHQNTALKLKANELIKRLEKDGGTVASNDRSEILALQQEKQKLEDAVVLLTQNNSKLSQESQILKNQLNECTEVIKELSVNLQKAKEQELLSQKLKELQQENELIKQAYQQKQNDYDAIHSQYLQLSQEKLELLSIKEKYQLDMNEIRQSINENNANQNMIIQEYEGKLDEYKQAYDKNQEIIEQLSQQLQESQQYTSQDIYPNSYDEIVGESEGELAIQCKNLENNFLMALDEKDQLIATLQASKEAIANELVTKDQIIDELSANNSEQANKLEEIGTILERYTQKMKEMENKYEQLWQKHEQEKQRTSKTESSFNSEKCRKCQELTKTIFRLNSHLNKRT